VREGADSADASHTHDTTYALHRMSSSVVAAAYAIGNIASSVALILVNKEVFRTGFHFPMTLSFAHFVFAMLWYQCLARVGAYEKPRPGAMPLLEQCKVAAAIFASIAFMNLSLNANSIGFYQVTKLTVIPVTLAINSCAYGVHTTTKLKLSLALLLAGVGVASVTEVHLKPLGMLYGILAVVSTAVCQIWQGTKQSEFGVSATQLQALTARWMAAQALVVAVATEMICMDSGGTRSTCDTSSAFVLAAVGGDTVKRWTMLVALGACALALLVNFTVFGLIGRTSAVTFQVVGHAKTCLVLIGGYVFFPSHGSSRKQQQQLQSNILGVSIAMLGVFLYGHLKHTAGNKQPDCFDHACPGCVLDVITSAEEKAERAGSDVESREMEAVPIVKQ